LIKSNVADQGSLAVSRGSKIFANGTASQPIIFTSSNDTMNAWHLGTNEWGNLSIMGNALLSASEFNGSSVVIQGRTNTAVRAGLKAKQMEGIVPVNSSDHRGEYGGNNDNDDSGGLHYVSLRYGGKVVGQGNELNGLSMGAIGRATDVDHID